MTYIHEGSPTTYMLSTAATNVHTCIYNVHSGQAQRVNSEARAVATWQKKPVITQLISRFQGGI